MHNKYYVQVALFANESISLEYILPKNQRVVLGQFVEVPLGPNNHIKTGVIISNTQDQSSKKYRKIKHKTIHRILDLYIPQKHIEALNLYSIISLKELSDVMKQVLSKDTMNSSVFALNRWDNESPLKHTKTIYQGNIEERSLHYFKIAEEQNLGEKILVIAQSQQDFIYFKNFFKNKIHIQIIETKDCIPNIEEHTVLILSSWKFASIIPIPCLRAIIIDKPEKKTYTNFFYKINTTDVTCAIAYCKQIPLVLGQEIISIDHAYRCKYESSLKSNSKDIILQSSPVYLTMQLEKLILETLSFGGNILILTSAVASHAISHCKICGHHNKCTCNGELFYYYNDRHFKCFKCSTKYNLPLCCMKCTGLTCIKKIHNIENVCKLLHNRLKKQPININNIKDVVNITSQIFVGSFRNKEDIKILPNLEKVILLYPDQQISSSNPLKNIFVIDDIYNVIASSYYFSQYYQEKCDLIVCCKSKELLPMIKNCKISIENLLNCSEMKQRQIYGLPPFGRCISISFSKKMKEINSLINASINTIEKFGMILKQEDIKDKSCIWFSVHHKKLVEAMTDLRSVIKKEINSSKISTHKINCDINIETVR